MKLLNAGTSRPQRRARQSRDQKLTGGRSEAATHEWLVATESNIFAWPERNLNDS